MTDTILDAVLRGLEFAEEELAVVLKNHTLYSIRETLDGDGAEWVERVERCDTLIAQLKFAIAARTWEQPGGAA
jgi:hypothetical protein